MNISIKTIPHFKQRYCTCGDYWMDIDGTLQIRISEMKDVYIWLVLVHEIVEICLCIMRGISFNEIDKFDINFEKERGLVNINSTDEPGDSIDSPYRDEHCIATAVERLVCGCLGVSWKKYENTILNLEYRNEGNHE